jgi:DNA polymerase (family 10)
MGGNGPRIDRTTAYLVARRVWDAIDPLISKTCIAGSYRRGLPTCGDVDIVVIPRAGVSLETVNEALASVCDDGALEQGGELSIGTVPIGNGEWASINVFYTTPENWGAMLLYATGSRLYNIRFRGIGKSRGLRVSQYGVFRGEREEHRLPRVGFSERSVCRAIGVGWLPPEARTGKEIPVTMPFTNLGVTPGASHPGPRVSERRQKPGRRRRF